MPTHTACVLTIGDELLNGDVINTNATWLGQILRIHGLPCRTMISVADHPEQILRALDYLWKHHDLVVVTGGLGPTRDDVTKDVLLRFFDDHLIRDPEVQEHVADYFRTKGRPVTDINRRQADIPSRAKVLFNELGTAPGLLMEKNGKLMAAMPGVPYELHHITEKRLIPELEKRWYKSERRIRHNWFRTTGIGESDLSDRILTELENRIPEGIDIAFLPHPGGVDIHVTEVNGSSRKKYDAFVEWIRETTGEFIFSEDYGESLARNIVTSLSERKQTVALAESCTGGSLADALTDAPGSSACFQGGVIAYDNRIKTDLLGISRKHLETDGAVSSAVALEMAQKAGEMMHADFALSTTGVAGPGGGTPDKPVGTVWIGFWSRSGSHFACRYRLTTRRRINKERTCAIALDLLRRHIAGISGLPHQPEVVYP